MSCCTFTVEGILDILERILLLRVDELGAVFRGYLKID